MRPDRYGGGPGAYGGAWGGPGGPPGGQWGPPSGGKLNIAGNRKSFPNEGLISPFQQIISFSARTCCIAFVARATLVVL